MASSEEEIAYALQKIFHSKYGNPGNIKAILEAQLKLKQMFEEKMGPRRFTPYKDKNGHCGRLPWPMGFTSQPSRPLGVIPQARPMYSEIRGERAYKAKYYETRSDPCLSFTNLWSIKQSITYEQIISYRLPVPNTEQVIKETTTQDIFDFFHTRMILKNGQLVPEGNKPGSPGEMMYHQCRLPHLWVYVFLRGFFIIRTGHRLLYNYEYIKTLHSLGREYFLNFCHEIKIRKEILEPLAKQIFALEGNTCHFRVMENLPPIGFKFAQGRLVVMKNCIGVVREDEIDPITNIRRERANKLNVYAMQMIGLNYFGWGGSKIVTFQEFAKEYTEYNLTLENVAKCSKTKGTKAPPAGYLYLLFLWSLSAHILLHPDNWDALLTLDCPFIQQQMEICKVKDYASYVHKPENLLLKDQQALPLEEILERSLKEPWTKEERQSHSIKKSILKDLEVIPTPKCVAKLLRQPFQSKGKKTKKQKTIHYNNNKEDNKEEQLSLTILNEVEKSLQYDLNNDDFFKTDHETKYDFTNQFQLHDQAGMNFYFD